MSEMQFVKKEDFPDMPKILYKYRTWEKEEHKKLLTHGEIYYASPNEFNEVTECNLERDYDSITEETIWKYCIQHANREVHSGKLNKSLVEVRAKILYETNCFHDLENREKFELNFRNDLNNQLSIFCTSETPLNDRLWNSFSAEKTGYCVGIDFTEIYTNDEIFGSCAEVNYYDESDPPKISPLSFSEEERISSMLKLIYNLPSKYKEEAEFRFTKMHIKDPKVLLKPEWIKEVILGSEINSNSESEIVELVKVKYPNATLKKLFVEPTFGILSIIDYKKPI